MCNTMKSRVAGIMVFAALLNPFNVCASEPAVAPTAVTQRTVTLHITGTITNFKEFQACANKKGAYIQLVPFSNGSFQTLYGADGGVQILSDLDRWDIPRQAKVSFSAPKTVSGAKYILAFQKTNCDSTFGTSPYNRSFNPFFMKDHGHVFIIDIPKDAKSPFLIDTELLANIH
jgi:hypothetical protein